MSTRLGSVGPLAAAVILVGTGCMPPAVPRYVEPPPEAPHALVVVSNTFSSAPGSFVDHDVNIDGRKIALAKGGMKQSDSAVRVAPGQVRWTFASRFYHFETRQVLANVDYTESEYDSCARTDYEGRCESGYRTVTKSRLETRSKTVEVDDAHCVAADGFVLDAARAYRIAYTFVAENACTIKCSDVTDREHEVACAAPAPITPPSAVVATSTTTAPPSTAGAPAPAAPRSTPPVPTPPKTERPLAPLGTGLVVAGGVGLLTAGVAAAVALNDRETVRKHCDANGTCDADGLAAASEGSTATAVATTSFGVGGALVAGGIGVLLWGPTKEVPRASVSASANGAELRIGGTF